MVLTDAVTYALKKDFNVKDLNSSNLEELFYDYSLILRIHRRIHPKRYNTDNSSSFNINSISLKMLTNDEKDMLANLFVKYPTTYLVQCNNAQDFLTNLIRKSLNTFRLLTKSK